LEVLSEFADMGAYHHKCSFHLCHFICLKVSRFTGYACTGLRLCLDLLCAFFSVSVGLSLIFIADFDSPLLCLLHSALNSIHLFGGCFGQSLRYFLNLTGGLTSTLLREFLRPLTGGLSCHAMLVSHLHLNLDLLPGLSFNLYGFLEF